MEKLALTIIQIALCLIIILLGYNSREYINIIAATSLLILSIF